MLDEFLKCNTIKLSDSELYDLKRLLEKAEINKASGVNSLFISLASIYISLEKHCSLIEQYKADNDTPFHRELNALEKFTIYLIDRFSFEYDFKTLMYMYNNRTEFLIDEQTWIVLPEASELPQAKFEKEDTETGKIPKCKEKEDFGIELEEF